MEKTLQEIADLVGGTVKGDPDTRIRGVSGMREAQPGDITFLANQRYVPLLRKTRASAIVVPKNTKGVTLPLVTVGNPDLAFARIVELFNGLREKVPGGIHPTAIVAPGARIGRDVSIGAHCVVEDGAEIGDGVVLYPNVYVGQDARIGAKCLFYPMVVVCHHCLVGSNVILHSGVVVGSDGFGYATVEGRHIKIPQAGIAVIEDDVEIGAGTTISRARFDRTLIRRGTKIDNLVQIGHNVEVGENCLIVSQTGIAGSTKLGKHVVTGGQTGIVGHLTIGDGSIIAAQSGVTKDLSPGSVVSGEYSLDHNVHLRQLAALRKLPSLMREVKELRERLDRLKAPGRKRKKGPRKSRRKS